jgi:steroid delta-isomerase-like uncharacterized protein
MNTRLAANKDVVRQYVEAFNRGDLEKLKESFTPDASVHGVLGWGGLEVALPIWKELHEAFKIELSVEEMIAEEDVVAVRYVERGTFAKPFRGRPPTGKSYELVAMEWFSLQEGRIHRRWGARDSAFQARQIGM